MIGLTVVATASGLALRNTARAARADVAGGVTVQIVHGAPRERDRQAQAALAVLKATPGIAEARLVPQQELDALVEPWLGTSAGDDVNALPVPALIDVRLAGSADPARVKALGQAVRRKAPAARIDAQASWLAPVFEAVHALQWLAGGLIALLAFATIATVLLASRNALGNHRSTIEIVHMLGGTDAQIARIFQRSMAVDAAAGGIGGLLLGVVVTGLLGRQFAALGSGMMAAGGLVWSDWIAICCIPICGVLLAVITARLTVLSALRRML
ncbi:ABC transporter permease [Novosphingobium sp. THN1]|uniref:cell division protein FtsX n=1 Tax=Novosphingobium sp. THN1 TaxID=1016987 RepID=UPI001F07AE94|nr:cell division protein [Novosphingobium sp. THN1]